MEITEVVTPSVAIPVLGVLVCAFLVFAFGFKSPGQPPSFDAFDEESKKKRARRSKGKNQSNGHALTIPDEGSVSHTAKPQQSPKQTKQTSKQQATSPKTKQVSQLLEQPKKVKKQAPVVKEAVKEQPVAPKEEPEPQAEDDGWQTISNKNKKQKKKDERGESPIEEKLVAMEKAVAMEEPVTIVTEEKQEPAAASPQDQRQKKKKDKKARKGKLESEGQDTVQDTEQEPAREDHEPVIDIEIVPEQAVQPQLEVLVDNNVESQIQDAMETHDEEAQVVKKKSKNKKKKSSPAPEIEQVVPAPVQPEPASIEPEPQPSVSPSPSAEEETVVTVKSPKKKQKKERSKEPKTREADEGGASGSIEPSLSHSHTDVSKQSPKITQELPSEEVAGPTPGSEAAAPGPGPSFDELGGISESWTEAKPKSKKKKARREN